MKGQSQINISKVQKLEEKRKKMVRKYYSEKYVIILTTGQLSVCYFLK